MSTCRKFEMVWSSTFNKYKAYQTELFQTPNSLYIIEVFYDDANTFNTGKCFLKIFTNGKNEDLLLNGWIFPCTAEGSYHFRGTYDSINSQIECYSSQKEYLKINIYTNDSWEMSVFAELYLNNLFLLSNCQNIEEYKAIKSLKESSFTIYSLNNIIDYAQQLKAVQDFITNYQEQDNTQESFVNHIKQMFEKQLNLFKDSIHRSKLNND